MKSGFGLQPLPSSQTTTTATTIRVWSVERLRGGAPSIDEATPSSDENAPSAGEESPSDEEGTPSAEERDEVGSKDGDISLFAESVTEEGSCIGESLLVAFVSEISLSRFEESWKGTEQCQQRIGNRRNTPTETAFYMHGIRSESIEDDADNIVSTTTGR